MYRYLDEGWDGALCIYCVLMGMWICVHRARKRDGESEERGVYFWKTVIVLF